jgi:hypothetical protein
MTADKPRSIDIHLFALFGVPLEAATSDAVPNRAYLHILHVPYMNE